MVLKNDITDEELENFRRQWDKVTKKKIIIVPPEFSMDEYYFEIESD